MSSQLFATDGNTYLVTGYTYSGTWGVASATGANGDTAQTSYNAVGWPSATTMADGAIVAYTYTPNTHNSTTGTRYKRNTVDGFGRIVSVETGDGVTYSTVD